MNWQNRIQVDPENNRRGMSPAFYVVIVLVLLALCLGVYFGFFAGFIVYGG